MSYLILLLGLLLLSVNVVNWRRLARLASLEKNSSLTSFPPLVIMGKLWVEWKKYALGDMTMRGMRNLFVALFMLLVMVFVNIYWLRFDAPVFIPVVITALVVMQIRIGRALHRRHFEDVFPEVLSVVNAAVSAGNSIHQALHRCGEGIEGELGKDFNRIDRRLNLGEEPERVFNDTWRIYPYREFYFFVIVTLVSIQRGGQLRTLIGRLSRIVNNSKTTERRKKAMTSEARSSAKIVSAIPLLFFLGMKYFSPQNFDFVVNDPIGRYILYYVIGSELLGMIIIWVLLRRAV